MTGFQKIPYTDDVVLYERSPGAVSLAPEAIADHFGLTCDHGYDDLDDFKIIIAQRDGRRIAFYRHKGARPGISLVVPLEACTLDELTIVLLEWLGGAPHEFQAFDELW